MSGSDGNFQLAMNQGHSAAWEQNWDQAAAFYRQALAESPDHPLALTSLGLALIELQEYEDAMRCYQKAARIQPQDPIPLERIGQLCERMGNRELSAQAYLRAAELYIKTKDAHKAVENWERVMRLDPENLQALSRLAMVYDRIGEKAKAVNAYLASARVLQAAGNPEKARQAIELALKTMPDHQEALQYLGLLRDFKPLPQSSAGWDTTSAQWKSTEGQPPTTQEKRTEADPVDEAAQLSLSTLARMLFETEEDRAGSAGRKGLKDIVTGISGALNQPQDYARVMLHLSQVVESQTNGDYSQATEELQRAVDLGLEHPAALFDLGYLYAQSGRPEHAIRCLQTAVNNADFALGARILLGGLYYQKGVLREASLEFLQALKLADVQLVPPDRSNELLQLYELLIESYQQEVNPAAQAQLCENLQNMLNRDDWRSQLRRARRQLPGYKEKGPVMPLAEVLNQASSSQVIESISTIFELTDQGLVHSAMEEAFFALMLAPAYLPMHALMGEMLIKLGDEERAASKFQVISRAYAARGEMQQAVQFARRVVALSPMDLDARSRLIELLIAASEVEKAIEEYILLAEVHQSLADLGAAHEVYMEAFAAAQQANLDRKIKIKLLFLAADIDTQSMDWRKALRLLEQIRAMQPDDQEARSQIIRLNLRLGQEAQAFAELDNFVAYMISNRWHAGLAEFIERLVEDYPNNISFRRRLVDTYSSSGQISEAVKHLDHIGEVLLQAGERAGAIQTIETIISLAPPNRDEYLTLLNQLREQKI